MDEILQLIDGIISGIDKVADSSGIVKCVLIEKIYYSLKELGQKIQILNSSLEDENKQLKLEIDVLKEQISAKKN